MYTHKNWCFKKMLMFDIISILSKDPTSFNEEPWTNEPLTNSRMINKPFNG